MLFFSVTTQQAPNVRRSSRVPCYRQSITKVSIQTNKVRQLRAFDAPACMAVKLNQEPSQITNHHLRFPRLVAVRKMQASSHLPTPSPSRSCCLFVANPPCTFHPLPPPVEMVVARHWARGSSACATTTTQGATTHCSSSPFSATTPRNMPAQECNSWLFSADPWPRPRILRGRVPGAITMTLLSRVMTT